MAPHYEDDREPRVRSRGEVKTLLAEQQGLPAGLSVEDLFWSDEECRSIEHDINGIKALADSGRLRSGTIDRTPLRSKYFFGYGYTYGAQVSGKGQEQLLPPEYVDPIPDWVHDKLITRLEEKAIVPKGWINSAVVNDYSPGGMIVSHIDPKQLFARPICIATFFAEGRLVFGVQFAFAERRFSAEKSSMPKYVACMPRGSLTLMDGFSADSITHGIRPEDFDGRRVSVVLRHVFPHAPTMSDPSAVLKPAQRGAPASAARRVGPAASGAAPAEDRKFGGGEAKRTLEFQLCDDDEPPAKTRRKSPPPAGGSRGNSLDMLRRIQGTYSDERSGSIYEVSSSGLVRVTFAPPAFGARMASTTWKVEPDGEGRLVCGKGILMTTGIRSDRLVWTPRRAGGRDLVWLRVEGDAATLAASTSTGRLVEGGIEEENPDDDQDVDFLTNSHAVTSSPLEAIVQSLAPTAASALNAAGLARSLAGLTGPIPASMPSVVPAVGQRGGGKGSSPSRSSRHPRGPNSNIRPSASVGSLTAIGPGRPGGFCCPSANTHPSASHLTTAAGPFAAACGSLRALSSQEQDSSRFASWHKPEAPCLPSPPRPPSLPQPPLQQPSPPLLVEELQPSVPAERMWFYQDSHGATQGPFASALMSEWSRQGFFPESTMVRAEDEEEFSELGNGMRLLTAALTG